MKVSRPLLALLLVTLMSVPPIPGVFGQGLDDVPPLVGEDSQVPDSPGEGFDALSGTLGYATGVPEKEGSPIYRIYHEGFEGSCTGLPDGWSETTLPGGKTGWHRDCYSARDFSQGKETAIVYTGEGALSIRRAEGGYPAGIDSRATTPVIDLRHVGGASIDTNTATNTEDCSGLVFADDTANATTDGNADGVTSARELCESQFADTSLHDHVAELRMFFDDLAENGDTALKRSLGEAGLLTPDDVSDLPLTEERYGSGMVNLSFWHYWDFTEDDENGADDGGIVEVRWERDDGTWSDWTALAGDLVFETNVSWSDAIQATGCKPWLAYQRGGTGGDGLSGLTPAMCQGYNYYDDVVVDGADTSGVGASLSTLYANQVEGRPAAGPNGRVDTDQDPHTHDPPGYVKSSGKLVYTTYTLNRFIGHRVQVGFHAVSAAESQTSVDGLGWFIDDVQVSALLPSRDVGIDEVLMPQDGDTVNVNHNAVMPKVVVKNYGRSPVDRVNVTFQFVSADGTGYESEKFYAPSRNLSLGPLGSAVVSPSRPWLPTDAGAGEGLYTLLVDVRIDPVVGPDGYQGIPEDDVNKDNNHVAATFRAGDVQRAVVDLDVDQASVLTDVDEPKEVTITVSNVGNMNLTGLLCVRYRTTDTSVSPPAPTGEATDITTEAFAGSTALPFGRTIASTGYDGSVRVIAATWNTQGLAPGVYFLNASFYPASALTKDGGCPTTARGVLHYATTYAFVRSTRAAGLVEGFALPGVGSPYPDRAVEAIQWVAGGFPKWYPQAYHTGHADFFESEFVPMAPTVPQGYGVWMAHGSDCRQTDTNDDQDTSSKDCVAGSTNLADWYVLRRDVTTPADATSLRVSFLSQGFFTWDRPLVPETEDSGHNFTRGLVRIMPQDTEWFQDYLQSQGSDRVGQTIGGTEVTLVDHERITEDGVTIEEKTYRVGNETVDVTVLSIQDPHTWRRYTTTVDIERFGTTELAVEWVLESTPERLAAYRNDGDVWCQTGPTSTVTATTCPTVAEDLINHWYLDDISIEVLADGTLLADETFEAGGETAASQEGFRDCTDNRNGLDSFNRQTQPPFCRGWGVEILPTRYPSNWYIETLSDADATPTGSREALRFGLLTNDPQAPDQGYGGSRTGDGRLTLSTIHTPEFGLEGYREPVLTFWTKHAFDDGTTAWFEKNDGGEPRYHDGASVWIVVEDANGNVIARDILTPEGGYNGRLYVDRYVDPAPTEQNDNTDKSPYPHRRIHHHPDGAVYDGTTGNNIFAAASNPDANGDPRWMQVTVSLEDYVALFADPDVRFRIEFQAIVQSEGRDPEYFQQKTCDGPCYWRIDDVRVEDRAAANDVALKSLDAPAPGRDLGPGLTQVIRATVENTGLYPQTDIVLNYTVLDANMKPLLDASGNWVTDEILVADEGTALPGLLSDDPERTLTDSFGTPWVPPETDQAQYFIRVRADLRTYEDTNPGNNEIIVPFTVVERHAVGIRSAAEIGDDEVVTPVIGGVGDARTFRVPVVNLGTMPEDFDGEALGDLGVRLVVRSEVGDVLVDLEKAIPSLPVGASTTVVFEDAWVPQASGLYVVEFHLIIPDGLEGTGQDVDNLRTLKVMVFNNIVPAQNEVWKDAFVGDEPWHKSTTSTDGLGWSFQGPDGAPYANFANGTLDLSGTANFRSIRNLFLTVEHRYDLEEGYDGGLVEVSPDGGKTWYVVPPKDGYPGVMTGGSPLVEDPFNPPHAITGVQADYVTWDFNLGAVDALQRIVPLREESFDVALPDANVDNLTLSPRGGDGMWFSDKYAVKCDRVYKVVTHTWNAADERWTQTTDNVPHTISFPAIGWQAPSPYPQEDPKSFGAEYCHAEWDHAFHVHDVPDAEGNPFKKYEYQLWTRNLQAYPYLDTVKTLRAPLDLAGLPPADTALEVSFWDWRAIGSTVRIDTDKSRQPIQSPNGIEVNLVYGSESVPLLVYDRSGNFDRYRDWARNTFVIPADEMEKVLAHAGPVYLEFAHHIATGLPYANLGDGTVKESSPADSDWQSPHFGWAIDDVRVAASFPGSLPGGQEVLSVTDPLAATDWETAYSTTCLDRSRVTESDCSTGTSREFGSGKASWRAEDTLTFGDVWSVSPVTTPPDANLAPGHTRTLLVARPPDHDVGGLRGADERLELDLDLKSAVDAVTLTFDTEYKFTTYVAYDHLGNAVAYPASGGRVEVSTDAGRTWTPLSPVDGANGVAEGVTFCQQSSTATHTPLAGRTADPQANSGFGLCGSSLVGRTGSYHEDLFFGFKGQATYDLSEFAGKEVLLGFRAFFTTNREVLGEAVTAPLRGGDAWYIDNLTVNAAVLDVRDAQIRLRAAADGSVTGDGWDVRDLRLLGVKHAHNVAVAVPPLSGTGYVPKGVTPFTVELINKGQLDAEDILLHVWVNATRPDGTRALAPYTVEYEGPLSMFDVCPSSLDAPDGDDLDAETNTYLCGFGGSLMEFHANTGYTYDITARAAHANLAHDPLYADDVATRALTPDRILSDPVIRVKEMTVAPNVLEAGSDDVADITVVLENFGATRASIKSFTLVVEGTDIRIVGSDCASDGSTVLEKPLETRTFRCEVAAGDFTRGGVFVANVTVVTDGTGEPTRSETRVLYVGSSLLADLGFDDHVEREYEFTFQDPESWYESNNANTPCNTDPAPWTITDRNDRTYWNNTWYHSFILPVQNPTRSPGDGGAPPDYYCGANAKYRMHNELTSPLIPVDHFEGPDGEPGMWLTFYSRHAFTGTSYASVSVSLWDKAANKKACADPIEAHTITGRSTDYVRGRYLPITVDVGAALAEAKEAGMNCIDSPHFPWDHVALHFRAYDHLANEWQIDDISLAPIGAAIGPPTRATAQDDTDKRYRLVLENRGGYSDAFGIHLTDDEGGKASVPSGWHIVVLDEAGDVVWPPEAQYTPAPAGCSDIEDPQFADAVALDAGESGVLEAKVCIPISESQTGRTGDVNLGITAQSRANPFHNVTAPLIVSYEYALRPNLVIPANGISIDNPDLPVDQPRTVTVTVVNVGPLDAEDVVIRVEDTADDSTGRPTVLRGVNGDAVAPIAKVPIGESVTRTFLWTPSVTGWHNLSIAVDPEDTIRELRENDNAKRIPLFITKPEFPDLVVKVTPETHEPARGNPIWVDMAITNVGGKTATGVQLTLKAGVTDLLIHEGSRADDLIVRIDPGETVHVNKTWVPAFPGNITLIAGALPRFGILERVETQDDNYDLVSVLVRSQGLSLDADDTTLEAALGESVSVDITVSNFGETVDTYAINPKVPSGVQAVVYHGGTRASTIDLGSGKNATLRVTFTLPHAMAAGAYDITLEGVSRLPGGGTSGARDTLDVVLHVAPVHDLSVESPLQRLTPGRHVIPVSLINDGNAEEAVTLTAPRLPDGWTSEAEPADVAPYGTGTANLTLVLPGDTPAGIYEVFIVADNADGPLANGTLLVEVLEHEVMRATVVGETSGVRAGRVLDLSLDVVNDGNVRGEAALNVTVPSGWTKVLGRSLVALEPSERASVPLALVVPEDAEPDSYPVTVDVIGLEATRTTRTNLTVAESDLEIIDFVFTPRVNVEPGTVMTFNATVLNSGLPARDVTVAFYVDDFLLGVQAIPLVGRDNTTDVGFRWMAQPGEHVILVIVDPEDRFREDDEANNARLAVVTTTGEVGILGAARQAVPGAGAALAVVTLAGAALWAARRTRT